jgi:hypothetical protein
MDLSKEDIKLVDTIWNNIKTGRAASKQQKEDAVAFWNRVGNKKYKLSTSCGACLSDVYNGIAKLYKKYYELNK